MIKFCIILFACFNIGHLKPSSRQDIVRKFVSNITIVCSLLTSNTIGCPTGLVHGLQIDLDESVGHVKPKHRVNMKALLSGQLSTNGQLKSAFF
jgi:hypothetical protein